MPNSLSDLTSSARESAERRGHRLGAWSIPPAGWYPAIAVCERCGMEAHATRNPPPNGIDVGGAAVALNCGDDHV